MRGEQFAPDYVALNPKAVVPTFKERFPNVEVEIIDEPLSEGYTKVQMRAASKSATFNCAIADSNQWTALGNIDAMESFEPLLAADPGWACHRRRARRLAHRH